MARPAKAINVLRIDVGTVTGSPGHVLTCVDF